MFESTIGQYYVTDSILHKLDPRTKIVGIFVYLFSLFWFDNYAGYIVPFAFFVVLVVLSKVPVRFMFKGLGTVMFIILLTAGFNMVLTKGEVIFYIGTVTITKEGIYKAGFLAIRLMLLVIASSLLTLCTTPKQLTDGLEKILSPLNKIGFFVDEFAMIISIAIRFIPILTEEFEKIKKAQLSRGANWEEGGVIQRIKAMIPLIIPLFVSATKRAGELSFALEARCWYGGVPHTKMHPLKMKRRDAVAFGIVLIYVIVLNVHNFV